MTTSKLTILLLLLILAACSRTPDARLQHAESLMEQHPDSALAILSAITDTFPHSEYDRNVHRVLLTEARYKCFINDTSDSVISLAAKYFDRNPKSPYRTKAYLYKGIINLHTGHVGNAIVSLLDAQTSACERKDILMEGLADRALGDAFNKMKRYGSAISFYTMARDKLIRHGENPYTDYSEYDVARSYHNAARYNEAIKLTSALADKVINKGNRDLYGMCMLLIADSYFSLGNYEKAVQLYDSVWKITPNIIRPEDWETRATAFLYANKYIECLECRDSIIKYNYVSPWLDIELARKIGDYNGLGRLLENLYVKDRISIDSTQNSDVEKILIDYHSIKTRNARMENRQKLLIIAFCLSLALLIIGFIIYRFVIRLREYREKSERAVAELGDIGSTLLNREDEISGLKSKLHDREELIKESRKLLRENFSSKFSVIEKLTSKYHEFKGTPKEKRVLADEIIRIIEDIRNDGDTVERFRDMANRLLDNIIVRFKEDFTDLKDSDYRLFLYLVLGFSTRAICVFLNIGSDVFYNRKSSLKRKIITSPNCKEYIHFF